MANRYKQCDKCCGTGKIKKPKKTRNKHEWYCDKADPLLTNFFECTCDKTKKS